MSVFDAGGRAVGVGVCGFLAFAGEGAGEGPEDVEVQTALVRLGWAG